MRLSYTSKVTNIQSNLADKAIPANRECGLYDIPPDA